MNTKKLSDIEMVEKSLNQLKEEYVKVMKSLSSHLIKIILFHQGKETGERWK